MSPDPFDLPADPSECEYVASNLAEVQQSIADTAKAAYRQTSEIRLVAVTKYASDAEVAALYTAGHRDFGESRVQDANARQEKFPDDISWHMIGHLQRNKAKHFVEGYYKLLHSLDNLDLADVLNRRMENEEEPGLQKQSILLEVNYVQDEAKYGFHPEKMGEALDHLQSECPHLEPVGLMVMAPHTDDEAEVNHVFEGVRRLRDQLVERSGQLLPELSMGMSNDYEIAILQGATIVRVGSALIKKPGE
jgi:pyridoxal phosphate enzyme (YggS family)